MASDKNQGKKPTGGRRSGTDYGITIARGAHVKGPKPRLMAKYVDAVLPELKKRHPDKNVMELPKIVKVVVNTCQGGATQNIKILEAATAELELITGQKAVVTRAKKSISAFKLRAGVPIGAAVTLRRERMYEFLDKLISTALARVRDFRGVSPSSFDGRGNYSLGIREQSIWPEIQADKVDQARGFSITVVTSAKTDGDAHELLALLGMPFRN